MKHHSFAKTISRNAIGILSVCGLAGAVAAWVTVSNDRPQAAIAVHAQGTSADQLDSVRVADSGGVNGLPITIQYRVPELKVASSLAELPLAYSHVDVEEAVGSRAHTLVTSDMNATNPEPYPMHSDGSVIAPTELASPEPPKLLIHPVEAPSDVDAAGAGHSVYEPPQRVATGGVSGTELRGLSDSTLPDSLQHMAGQTTVVYTPAQIKQAYGFAALPPATSANKFAYLGSGQTVVVIGAFDAPTVAADLNAFSVKFGLPTCTVLPNAYKAGVPINALVSKPKAGDGCAIQVLYVNATGGPTGTPPKGNVNWATEAALDVQWVHAIAPMAKIVLVEALSNSGNDLMNAMAFASKLGASVASMSFGATEFASQASYDGLMSPTMTWIASSGDWGVGVNWPASSARVLGVGGTYLSNLSPRAETGWTGSGGGLSKFVAMPAYQSQVSVPGNPAPSPANASKMKRGVPDVAYNASSSSGVYVNYRGNWYGMGGTSAGAPQWAGLLAVANAVRANSGKAPLSAASMQNALYGQAKASTYVANFLDIVSGANGTCMTCKAVKSYDLVTGLGTPHAASLMKVLVAAQ